MRFAKRIPQFAPMATLLATLFICLIWLPSAPNSVSTNLGASSDQAVAKLNVPIHRKLKSMARKAASAEWFMSQRTYGLGYIPKDAEIRAVEDMRNRMIPELAAKGYSLRKSAAGQLNWEFHGPGNIGGRLRGLVVHPNNPDILYAGSVSGGVWKSTNGGASWSPTMNDLITLNISALAMKPGDPNTIYAGTGEAFFTGDRLPGRGILKTTDGGNTWKRVHVAQGLNSPFIAEIAVSPANPNVVYAAGRKALPQLGHRVETIPDPGVSAIFKSTDSGETWQDVTSGKGLDHDPQTELDDFAAEVIVSPEDANVVYATFGIFYASGGIWKSADGGQAWSRLTDGLPDPNLPNLGYRRIELAMAPSNPNVLYASFAYKSKIVDTIDVIDNGMLGLWKTTNAGQSWTQVSTPLTINERNRRENYTTALGSQGHYDNAIIVHPTDPNIVFVAGLDIYKSTDGGNSWSQMSVWLRSEWENPEGLPYVHADHHVFAFDRSTNPPTLYNGSDGGVARSRDLGATWEILNNDLGVTQFYFFAAHPTDPNIMFGGTQDNGTPMVIDGEINAWFEITGGDGGPGYFDFDDPAILYTSIYFVNMYRSVMDYATGDFILEQEIGFTDGSNGITEEDVDGAAFFAPFEMSPNNPNVLVLGTHRVLKTTDRGDSWTPISDRFSTQPVAAVALAEGDDDIIWAATRDGRVFKTEDGGASGTEVTQPSLPNRFITDIEFDPSDNRTVYLTYSGYGTPHVFKTIDAGGSWTNITNNLPDMPVNAIQVHPQQPNMLFLGTDIGVFMSENGGHTWQPCANGFPATQVVAIQLNAKVNRIYAATHGRGVYSAELPHSGNAVLDVDVQEIAIQAKPGQSGAATFNLSNSGDAALNYSITATGSFGALAKAGVAGEARLSNFGSATADFPPRRQSQEKVQLQAGTPRLKALEARVISSPPRANAASGKAVLVLDDGNNRSDFFLGFGVGAGFIWMNEFELAENDFQLDALQFYMRTETVSENPVFLAVVDSSGKTLAQGELLLDLTPENRRYDGEWFTVPLTNPLYFKGGTRFGIMVGASGDIGYPAGIDFNAQIPDNSFYFDYDFFDFLNINKIAGLEAAAFLIRAVGAEIAGGNLPPSAKATVSKTEAKINETLTFDASNSSDPDGQITAYLWNFGDGNSSNQQIATHAYAQAGTYRATLTVIDDAGAKSHSSGQITITTATMTRLAVNPESGTIAPDGLQTITVNFDAQGLAEGSYQGELNIASTGGSRTIPVRIRVSNTVVVEDERAELPRAFGLAQNYPNPFNPETNIRYALPHNGNIVLAVFDLSGRRVATLASGTQAAGEYVVRWSGRDDSGNRVTSGIYFYRLEATLPNGAVTTLTKKLAVLK